MNEIEVINSTIAYGITFNFKTAFLNMSNFSLNQSINCFNSFKISISID